jgi:hypothetical protein
MIMQKRWKSVPTKNVIVVSIYVYWTQNSVKVRSQRLKPSWIEFHLGSPSFDKKIDIIHSYALPL